MRKLRKDIAQEENKPAYIVFHDATLKELAETQPTTAEQMMRVGGIGQKKFEQYGALFLGKILEYLEKKENAVWFQSQLFIYTSFFYIPFRMSLCY